MHLRCDPAFDIGYLNWDTFSRWEVRPDRRVGYLGDVDWDHNWEPVVSSDDEESDEDADDDDEDDELEDEDYEDEEDATASSCQRRGLRPYIQWPGDPR
jgi:hypothetical protein